MGFQISPTSVEDKTDAGVMHGIMQEVACGCWFTRSGKTLPKLIRAMDRQGQMHTIQVLEVLSSEIKRYSGIETVEHICRIVVCPPQSQFVKLIFNLESRIWKMVFL